MHLSREVLEERLTSRRNPTEKWSIKSEKVNKSRASWPSSRTALRRNMLLSVWFWWWIMQLFRFTYNGQNPLLHQELNWNCTEMITSSESSPLELLKHPIHYNFLNNSFRNRVICQRNFRSAAIISIVLKIYYTSWKSKIQKPINKPGTDNWRPPPVSQAERWLRPLHRNDCRVVVVRK